MTDCDIVSSALYQQDLNVGAKTWELEILRKPAGAFLQRSLYNVVMQFSVCSCATFRKHDVCTAEMRMLQCKLLLRDFPENCSATFVFACGMLQGGV